MLKLNTFHWHVVDSQSFPLEVPEFPELSEMGAYSPEEFYSVKDVQDIVEYASAVRTPKLHTFDSTSQFTFVNLARY